MKALTALALVAVLGLGIIVYMQNTEIVSLKKQIGGSSPMEERKEAGAGSVSGTIAAENVLQIDGTKMTIQYRCSGEIKKGIERVGEPAEEISFCVGDYELVGMAGDRSTVIASGHAVGGKDSPVLLKAESIGDQGTVLISYKPSCASLGECGAGTVTNDVTYLFRTRDNSVRGLSHFPPNGTPVWNAVHTRALFIPETCGGAGCDLSPIIGYDLTNDASKDITKEKGVGLGKDGTMSDASDPAGDRLPVWKSVEWKSADEFTATLIGSDGTTKKVTGKF